MNRASVVAVVLVLSAQANAQTQYVPPKASATALEGIDFRTAKVIGALFRTRFGECDAADHCDGKPVVHGCTRDLNRNKALLRLRNDVLFFEAKLGLDADGSPLSEKTPGKTDQKETSFRYPLPGAPSVDADKVPFIVIPGGGFGRELGVEPGDLATVVYGTTIVHALVADEGPPCKIGEGSIQLHELLGHPVCIKRNEIHECEQLRNTGLSGSVLVFIFPGSKANILDGLTPTNVNERIIAEGTCLFDELRVKPLSRGAIPACGNHLGPDVPH